MSEDSVQSPTRVCIERSISALSGESGLMVRQMDCCWRRMERVHRGWAYSRGDEERARSESESEALSTFAKVN